MRMLKKLHYLPIHPRGINWAIPGCELRLENNQEMRKLSYVNTDKFYSLPLHMLKSYDDKAPIRKYRLDSVSLETVLQRLSVRHQQYKLERKPSTLEQLPAVIESSIPTPQHTTPLITASQLVIPSYGAVGADPENYVPPITVPRASVSSYAASGADIENFTTPTPTAPSPVEPVRRNRRPYYADLARTAGSYAVPVLRISFQAGLVLLICYLVYGGGRWIISTISSVARSVSAVAHSVAGFFSNIGHGIGSIIHSVATFFMNIGHDIGNAVHAVIAFFNKFGHGVGNIVPSIGRLIKMILKKFRGVA